MDSIKVTIETLDNEGRGIATLPSGKKIFIPEVLPGEDIEAEITREASRYAEGKCLSLLSSSPSRILPFGTKIPGCNLIHLSYEGQLEYKKNKVRDCLTRIGKFDSNYIDEILHNTVPSEITNNYRNHMQYKISDGKVCLTLEGSNTPVPADNCPLEYEVFSRVRTTFEDVFNDAPTTLFSGLVLRGSERTHEIMVEMVSDLEDTHEKIINAVTRYLEACDVISKITCAIKDYKLTGITLRMSRSSVEKRTRGGKRVSIWGDDFYTEHLCGKVFRIKAGAFFQVNIPQAERLYTLASEEIKGASSVCDIYCGTGSIGLSVIRDGQQLLGVESVSEAVASAKINATLSGVTNAKFVCRPAEKFNFADEKLSLPIAAIVDPPRQGLDPAFINHLIKLNPDTISYVSCDPATMARDLMAIANSNKYKITSVTPVDMFPQTSHVETVALLTKLNVNEHIYVDLEMSELDITSAEKKASYEQIKSYVLENTGLKVSHLNIAQIKRKHGIIERECYNLPKSENSRQPNCTVEKEKAIVDALKYFKMI